MIGGNIINRGKFCKSKHRKSGRFLEVALLCLLNENSSYGYNLMEKLKEFGFGEDRPNLSILYRKLNRMEDDGMVLSSWRESKEGPDKKIYEITSKGLEELDTWVELLKNRKKRIDSIIEKYESTK